MAKQKKERKAPTGTIIPDNKAKRNDWQTPPVIMDAVWDYARGVKYSKIVLDPATAPDNPTRADRFCSLEEPAVGVGRHRWLGPNGLALQSWASHAGDGLVWVNPPYGAAAGGNDWLRRIGKEGKRCHMLALLSVSRTEQAYLTDTLKAANAVCFIRGRVAFRRPETGDLVSGIPYASWLLGFNVNLARFKECFEPICGTPTLKKRGHKSACFRLEAL